MDCNARTGQAFALVLLVACAGLVYAGARVTAGERAFQRALTRPVASDAQLTALDRALALDPGNGRARAMRARALLLRGRDREALAEATRAAAAFGSVDATVRRATILARLGRTDEALVALQAARRMWPDSPEVLAQLAATLYGAGRVSAAREVAQELNERAPDNADALYLLAACAGAAGDSARAQRHYRETRDLLSRGIKPVAVQIDAAVLDF